MKILKKCSVFFTVVYILFTALAASLTAIANSAEPIRAENGSGILFKQSDSVAIESEVLDINLGASYAEITAAYKMKNTTDNPLKIESMFLSPIDNGESKTFFVNVNGEDIPYREEFFGFESSINSSSIEDWEGILAANNERTQPLGEGGGFYEYIFENYSEQIAYAKFSSSKEFFIESNYYNADNDNKFTFGWYDRALIVSRGELTFEQRQPKSVTYIDDIYDYLYSQELNRYDEKPLLFDSQFNIYLKEFNNNNNNLPLRLFQYRYDREYVYAISYDLNFEPQELITVTVKYNYRLGLNGRSEQVLLYYLTPAKYWKDFQNITINLTLHTDFAFLKSSTLAFNQLENNVYQFKSETLPLTELKIVTSSKQTSKNINLILIIVCALVLVTAIMVGLSAIRLHKKIGK